MISGWVAGEADPRCGKDTRPAQLVSAIRTVARDEALLAPAVTAAAYWVGLVSGTP